MKQFCSRRLEMTINIKNKKGNIQEFKCHSQLSWIYGEPDIKNRIVDDYDTFFKIISAKGLSDYVYILPFNCVELIYFWWATEQVITKENFVQFTMTYETVAVDQKSMNLQKSSKHKLSLSDLVEYLQDTFKNTNHY